MSEVTIRYVPLDEALAARREDNPKAHDVPRIAASYQHHGVASLVVLNERDGRMVIGAGRTEAVASLRDDGSEPPEGVLVDAGGGWLLPALIVDLDPERATSLMLADNRTTELGGWDVPLLAAALLELAETESGLAAAGFDSAAVDAVVAQLEVVAPDGLTDPDALRAPPQQSSRVGRGTLRARRASPGLR